MPSRPSLSDYKAVLFDVDGTLVDSLAALIAGIGDSIEEFTEQRPSDSEIKRLIGTPLTHFMALHARNQQDVKPMIDRAVDRIEFHADREVHFTAAVETLSLCHRMGLRTALVTSKNTAELRHFLNRFEEAHTVDATVCASDVVHPKPNPESVFEASRRLGVAVEDCIFVGDSVYDIQCARGAGIPCVAVSYGAGIRELLVAEKPEILLDSPEDLLAWATEAFVQTSCRERK
jgi:HAD superfamily hydrolase (TIGR01549 family)